MGDINWVYITLYGRGKRSEKELRWGGGGGFPVLGHLIPKLETSRKVAIRTAEYYLFIS